MKKISALLLFLFALTACTPKPDAPKPPPPAGTVSTASFSAATVEVKKTVPVENISTGSACPVRLPDLAPKTPVKDIVSTEKPAVQTKTEISDILKGKVVCIDPGHGNPNHPVKSEPIAPSSETMKVATEYGTEGTATGIPEYKLTMAVSLKLRDELKKHGAKVVMTRESNEVDLGNVERAEIANKSSSDIFIRIHADGIDDSSVTGISVLYPGSRYIKDQTLLSKSAKAARSVLNSLLETTHDKSRGTVERNDLTGFNWSKVPVILVEMGFMTNPGEDRKLNTGDYQNKIVEGIIEGLASYFSGIK